MPLFLTPPGLPEGRECRTLELPASLEWLAVFNSAIALMFKTYNWEQVHDTDMSPEDAAAFCYEAWGKYIESSSFDCVTNDLAPYWEDESDIEGIVPEGETQQWWGVFDGLTFQESLENVFIAAYVGILAGAGAAVQFLVLARQFRLEFESDPYGGVIDILINGDKYQSVDTYSATPGIIGVDVITEDGFGTFDVDPNTLLVVLTDEENEASEPKVMHVVRMRLTPDDVSPPNFRYNSDTNKAEFSPDDGETWVDSDGTDPRHNPTYSLPVRVGEDAACDAAANMVAALRFVIDTMIAAPALLTKINTLLTYVKRFIPEIAFIIEIISYAANFLNIIKDDLGDAFTEDAYDMIECSLFCHVDENGTITAGQLEDVLADVFDYDPDVLFTATQFIFQTWWGEVGLSNAGAIGEEVGDCDDCACGWCHLDDFAVSDGGYARYTAGGNNQGTYNAPGGDWVCDPNGSGPSLCDIYKSFTAGTIDKVLLNFSNSNNDGGRPGVILYLSGTQVARIDSTIGVGVNDDLTNFEYNFGGVLADTIRTFNITALGGGTCSYQWIQLSGTGTSPFGADNC